jgi:hypothetical protein
MTNFEDIFVWRGRRKFCKKNFVNFFTRIKISFLKKMATSRLKNKRNKLGKAEGRAGNAKGAQRLMASRNIFLNSRDVTYV